MEKCYSTNEEAYNYDTLEEAAEYVFDDPDLHVGTVRSVFEGEPVKRKAGDYFLRWDSGLILEVLTDNAYEECGDFSEGWLDTVSPEQQAELTALVKKEINAWADKYNLHPTFYTVTNTREIKLRLLDKNGDWEVVGGQRN